MVFKGLGFSLFTSYFCTTFTSQRNDTLKCLTLIAVIYGVQRVKDFYSFYQLLLYHFHLST